MRFSPGESFDRYVIESLLGEGGMGEVYRAEDTRLGRKVALKVLRKSAQSDSETWGRAVARMQREARAVAALSHPGIVAVYDVGEHDGTPFIAMELASGRTLRALVGRDVLLGALLRVLLEVARALSAAHRAGIVHRDVKPENVIVRDDGAVKVLDFGVARKDKPHVVDPLTSTADGSFATMTADGAMVGTPAYMAPEQLRGEEIDARADQFAWGVVAYELFAGKLPFRADKGAVSLIASILSDDPAPLVGVPDGVWAIIERALEKEPDDRFSSMDEVVEDLEVFVTSEDQRAPLSRGHEALALTGGKARVASSSASRRLRRSRAIFRVAAALSVFAAVAAVGTAILLLRSGADVRALPLATFGAALPRPAPTVITDLPLPPTQSAEAKLAFREGLQALRDATWDTAIAAFDRARKADPGMGAAHLRYAVLNDHVDVAAGREAFRKAIGLRAGLSERDQAWLSAMEPVIQSDPPDYEAAARKISVVAARWPEDAEIAFWYARITLRQDPAGRAEEALALAERCLELDPQYADCWQTKELSLGALGRTEEASAALDKCVEVSAGAVDCLMDKTRLDSRLGRCEAVLDTTRRWMAKAPSSPLAYQTLGAALYTVGQPEAAVRAALDQAEKRYRALGQAWEADALSFNRAVAFGDFSLALRISEDMTRKLAAPSPDAEILLAYERAEVLVDIGQIDQATRIADDHLAKVLVRAGRTDSYKRLDPTVYMHAVRLRAGKMTKGEYAAAREEWITSRRPMTEAHKRYVWLEAYAVPAYSSELAEEALEKAKEYGQALPGGVDALDTDHAGWQGRLLFLAGRSAEAIPPLEKAVQICNRTRIMTARMHAFASLGMAREATGDKAGACSAYRVVLSRWGGAKDSSTVKEIGKRAKSLSCEVPVELVPASGLSGGGKSASRGT